jgi:ATP-dependent DNA helicase PIF1
MRITILAVLIGGSTLHSALGITPGLNPPPPTEMMRAAWSRVGVLFIDEFSMISPSLLTLLDKRLRQLKVRQDVPFGGIHVIFCGDFFQLPPIGAPTIYTSSTESVRSDTRTALYNWSGKELWNTCLTDVVELTESHRFADEKWAAALERWRINQPRKEDIADVNSRFMPCTSTSALPANAIIAVPENNTREQGIRFAEQEILARLGPVTETTSSWEKRHPLDTSLTDNTK